MREREGGGGERERESAICWVRDTEKIIKSNKIKKPKGKRRLNLRYSHTKGSVLLESHSLLYL